MSKPDIYTKICQIGDEEVADDGQVYWNVRERSGSDWLILIPKDALIHGRESLPYNVIMLCAVEPMPEGADYDFRLICAMNVSKITSMWLQFRG